MHPLQILVTVRRSRDVKKLMELLIEYGFIAKDFSGAHIYIGDVSEIIPEFGKTPGKFGKCPPADDTEKVGVPIKGKAINEERTEVGKDLQPVVECVDAVPQGPMIKECIVCLTEFPTTDVYRKCCCGECANEYNKQR